MLLGAAPGWRAPMLASRTLGHGWAGSITANGVGMDALTRISTQLVRRKVQANS